MHKRAGSSLRCSVKKQVLEDTSFLLNRCIYLSQDPPWLVTGVEINDMPHLKAWMKRIEERPAVQKGLDIPEENVKKQMARDPKKKEELIEGAKKMMISHK